MEQSPKIPTTSREMSRRKFLGTAAAALFAGVAIQILGCSTDGDDGSKTGSISANHGHRAVITEAQLDAGDAMTLHIAGSAGHDHTVELSADEVVAIRGGITVSRTSSTGEGHDHVVTFN